MKAVNLIPADQRGGASVGAGRSEGAVYAVLGLLAGLALFAFLYGRADHQISSGKARVATLEAQARQAQAQASELAPYTSFIALREQRVQQVSELVDSRFDWAHSFHELGRVLPRGATVSTLTGTIGSATASSAAPAAAAPAASSTSTASAGATTSVTSATPPGSVPTFTLGGCATSQSEVALTLDRLRLIDGVSEATLQSSAKGGSTSGGSGGCAPKDPVFTVQVAFDPLPATPTPGTATTATAAATSTGAGAAPAQPTTSTGGAR